MLNIKKLPSDWFSYEIDCWTKEIPLKEIQLPNELNGLVKLFVRRDDLIDTQISGNKFYKLYGHLRAWSKLSTRLPIASFGGAFSNHLYALAAACQRLSTPFFAIVRGERPANLSATLNDIVEMGAQLVFVDRADYRNKEAKDFKQLLEKRIGKVFWVPEGGGGKNGLLGCIEMGKGIDADVVCHACGTGISLAGLIDGGPRQQNVYGFNILKHQNMASEVAKYLNQSENNRDRWDVNQDFHFGGYAKTTESLIHFINKFEAQTSIPLDPVYTGKMMYGVFSLIKKGQWKSNTRIVAIHSGGLQGRRGFPELGII